jgi:hypothetical protein
VDRSKGYTMVHGLKPWTMALEPWSKKLISSEAVIVHENSRSAFNRISGYLHPFFLSLYFDNFIIGVGSAVFLMILGAIAANHRLAYLIPYTYPIKAFMGFMSGETGFIDKHTLISLIYGVVFFVGEFWLVSRKNIR